MKTFKGDLVIKKGDNTDYSQLTTVEGYISIDSGSFNLIFLKNCNTNSYKWIQIGKLEKILKNNYI